MSDEARRYTIEELAALAGVPVRTVRYYVAEGLLPGPGARGRAASYGEDQLARLRLIRRLVAEHVPLAELKARLARLSVEEVQALLAESEQRAAQLERPEGGISARDYVSALLGRARAARKPARSAPATPQIRALAAGPSAAASAPPPAPAGGRASSEAEPWQRWELAPGVELHVRAAALAAQRDLVERLLRLAAPARRGDPEADPGVGPGNPAQREGGPHD